MAGTSGARVGWVDTAKGMAIILVVVFHAVIFLDDIGLAGPWAALSAPLDTIMLQLFFFTAGLFAQRAVSQPFRVLFRRRVARLLWLYALWSLIWAVAFEFIPLHRASVDSVGTPLTRWLRSFIVPNDSMWFLYALAGYFIVAWCVRRLPAALQIGAAAVLSAIVGSSWVSWQSLALEKTAMYFVFFLVALHTGPQVRGLVVRVRWWQTAVAWVIHVGLFATLVRTVGVGVPGLRLLLGATGVAAGVCLSVALARCPWMSWLESLGQRTLEVYLAHFYVVLGLVAVLAALPPGVLGGVPVLVWVPTVALTAVLGSLALHRLTRRVPGLWDLPRRLQSGS